jgi:hypothetical protein
MSIPDTAFTMPGPASSWRRMVSSQVPPRKVASNAPPTRTMFSAGVAGVDVSLDHESSGLATLQATPVRRDKPPRRKGRRKNNLGTVPAFVQRTWGLSPPEIGWKRRPGPAEHRNAKRRPAESPPASVGAGARTPNPNQQVCFRARGLTNVQSPSIFSLKVVPVLSCPTRPVFSGEVRWPSAAGVSEPKSQM